MSVSVSQWWHVWHLQNTSQHQMWACHVFVVAVPGVNSNFASGASLGGCRPCSAHNSRQTFRVQLNDKKMNNPCNVLRRTNAYHNTESTNRIHYLTQVQQRISTIKVNISLTQYFVCDSSISSIMLTLPSVNIIESDSTTSFIVLTVLTLTLTPQPSKNPDLLYNRCMFFSHLTIHC